MTYHPKYSIRGIFINNKNWERYKVNHPELDTEVVREVERKFYSGTRFSTLIFERKSFGILLLTFKSSIPKIFPF